MSILDDILCRTKEGRLFPIVPPSQGQQSIRWMFVTDDIDQVILNPPQGEIDRFDDLHADLVSFTTQRYIPPEMIWLLKPKKHGVWEIRSHLDEPQIRVFGQFAQMDVFIGMTFDYRSDLGGIVDPLWSQQIRSVQHKWTSLFPGYSPKMTSDQHKLFSGAIDEKYFKD